MNLQPGSKSTEFLVVVVSTLLGLAVMNGFITPDSAYELQPALELIVGGLLTTATGVAYIVQRGQLKKAAIQSQPIVEVPEVEESVEFPLKEEPAS